MWCAYLDPSAWIKRYYSEAGSDLTDYLFEHLLSSRSTRLFCSRLGYTEVISVLNRHRNAGRISQSIFNIAYSYFEADSRKAQWLAVRNYQINASIRLLLVHNLNATDALHLQVSLQLQEQLYHQEDRLLFFSADQRLLRAAQTEGLTIFNPEAGTEAQLASYLLP